MVPEEFFYIPVFGIKIAIIGRKIGACQYLFLLLLCTYCGPTPSPAITRLFSVKKTSDIFLSKCWPVWIILKSNCSFCFNELRPCSYHCDYFHVFTKIFKPFCTSIRGYFSKSEMTVRQTCNLSLFRELIGMQLLLFPAHSQ